MTWPARLRLFLGLVVVIVAAGALTLHLNAAKGVVHSTSAQVTAQSYEVGTSWAGMVVNQRVKVGDAVSDGDPLFVIRSAELTRDVAAGLLDTSKASTVVDPDGNLVVTATDDGVVTKVDETQGTFVVAGSPLATVDKADSLTVRADLTLSPEQLSRLEKGARVELTLPDGTTLHGTGGNVSVRTAGQDAEVRLTVTSDQLVRGAADGLVVPGTPVSAAVHLRNGGVVSEAASWLGARWDGDVLPWITHTWSDLVR